MRVRKDDLEDYEGTLQEFLKCYLAYSDLVSRGSASNRVEESRTWLQRKTTLVDRIIGELVDEDRLRYTKGEKTYSFHAVLGFTVMEDASEDQSWHSARVYVSGIINEAIGNIENNTVASKEIKPVIPIKDETLRRRCLDLLEAPGSFDRVINQATQVLESRLRDSMAYERLCEVIPEAKDHIGEALANKLLASNAPVVVVSDNPRERAAFHKMFVGMIAYLRNPSHHSVDERTEWALAWSVVGIVDALLSELANSYVAGVVRDREQEREQQ